MGRTFGLSFSWERALGISAARARLSRRIAIALTQPGRERKTGCLMAGGGCSLAVMVGLPPVTSLSLWFLGR